MSKMTIFKRQVTIPLASEMAIVFAGLVLFVIAFHILTVGHIVDFYARNIPHYDSVGSYIFGFQVIDTYHRDGWRAAFDQASTNSLSITQSYSRGFSLRCSAARHRRASKYTRQRRLHLHCLPLPFSREGYRFSPAGSALIALLVFYA